RELPKDPNPSWTGYSVGHWGGDALVIETAGFDDHTWLDRAGHPHSGKRTARSALCATNTQKTCALRRDSIAPSVTCTFRLRLKIRR
ncbi:MAG TPA: hypothetical protein VG297_01105, partial [Bryobacteraceae bacterium]|nr:hypothetical protein [Bryobacteraceae bacterium]